MTKDSDLFSMKSKVPTVPRGIKYTHLMIGVMAAFMIVFVIDRFTSNVWPLYFTKASPIEYDFSATTFFVVGWIMGRELIVSSSLIWLLQCRCFWNFVFEHKPKWLLVDDIMCENNHLHYHLGWLGIGVPMIVHAWLVFLPLMQKHTLHVYLTWWRPIDPETGFYLENCHGSEVNVSINDVYALLVVTALFLIFFPLSMHKTFRAKHWTMAHYMHLFAALMYGIELLRTPFTAHCWFISTPFIAAYIMDRLLGIFYYRLSNKTKVVCQYNVDEKYILMFLNVPGIYADSNAAGNGTYREIGDCFWINTKKKGLYQLQPAHPFTTFYNHQSIISNRRLRRKTRSLPLGDRRHKFSVKMHKLQKSVSNTMLNDEVSYQLHRNSTHSVDETATTVTTVWEQQQHRKANAHDDRMDSVQQIINEAENKPPIAGLQVCADAPEATRNRNRSFWTRTFESLWTQKTKPDESNICMDKLDCNANQKARPNESGSSMISLETNWNVGLLIGVHARNDRFSFTEFLKQSVGTHQDILAYGPYRSSFANIIDVLENDDYRDEQAADGQEPGAVVLIATGAGAAFIIDFVLYLRAKKKWFLEAQQEEEKQEEEVDDDEEARDDGVAGGKEFRLQKEVRIHFSCRSVKLFQWITDFLCEESIENVHICAHLTSHRNVHDYDESQNLNKERKAKIGRASFDVFLQSSPQSSKVFFCGNPIIQAKLKILCQQLQFTFFEGHSFY